MVKNILIGVVFISMLMFSVSTYNNYIKINNQIQLLNEQQFGLNLIDRLYKINIILKEMRGLSQFETTDDIRIGALEKKLDYLLQNENIKLKDNIDIKFELKKFITYKNITKQEKFYNFSKIISLIEQEISSIASKYKLFVDIDLNNYKIVTDIIYTIPSMIESIGKIRGSGSYIISSKKIDDTLIYNLRDNFDNYMQNLENLLKDKKDIEDLIYDFENFNLIFKNLIEQKLKLDENRYFFEISVIIESINKYYKVIYEELQINLNKKAFVKQQEKQEEIVIYLIVLVLTIFFTFMIIKKINQNERKTNLENEEFNLLNQLHKKLQSKDNVKLICEKANKFICEYTNSFNSVMYLVDYKNKQFNLVSLYNISHEDTEHLISFESNRFNDIFQTMQSSYVYEKDGFEIKYSNSKIKAKKILNIPLVYDEKVIAIIQQVFIDDYESNLILNKIIESATYYIYKALKDEQMRKQIELIDKYVITSSTNKDGIITYASSAFSEISGYSKEELLNNTHGILKNELMSNDIYKKMWETIKSGKIWRDEIANKKKDGSTYWVDATITPEIGYYGDIIGFSSIRQDITNKKIIEEISITDSLTSLYNRRLFDTIFPKYLSLAKRENEILCFMLLDVDFFKKYNDTYGHNEGDKVLKQISKVLKFTFKREEDYIFRLGGEEFGVLFFCEDVYLGITLVKEFHKKLENENIIHEKNSASKYVTASSGIYFVLNGDNSTLEDIYKQADILLYKSKNNGKNQATSNIV